MKLLLDENLSRRLIPFLQHDYPGSAQVALVGLEAATDQNTQKRMNSSSSRGMRTLKSYHWYGGSPPNNLAQNKKPIPVVNTKRAA